MCGKHRSGARRSRFAGVPMSRSTRSWSNFLIWRMPRTSESCCSVLQCVAGIPMGRSQDHEVAFWFGIWQGLARCVAVCCSVVWCAVVCWSMFRIWRMTRTNSGGNAICTLRELCVAVCCGPEGRTWMNIFMYTWMHSLTYIRIYHHPPLYINSGNSHDRFNAKYKLHNRESILGMKCSPFLRQTLSHKQTRRGWPVLFFRFLCLKPNSANLQEWSRHTL